MQNNSLFQSAFAPPKPNAAITPQTLCPSNVPLVLFPVRLETRFFTLAGNVTELRVRIYPDKIHVDTHQPELTTDERTWGTQYWQQDWLAATDNAARSNAWMMLAGRFGAERAAWIARVLQPTNSAQRLATPTVPPVFPTLPPVGPNGESAWRHAPMARLLPDKWTAIIHSNGAVALSVTGNPIKQGLAVGPNPNAPALTVAEEAAIVAGDAVALDPDMMWMVDFNIAEANGMALRMTIPAAVLPAIDSLVVLGVATSLGVTSTTTQLGDLLDAHHYTDGLEFMRLGTATNNTDDRRASYSSKDPDYSRSFASEVMTDPTNAPNATRLGTALGLPTARIASTLGHIGQAAQNHDLDLQSMNTALWQVGWGYFLSNMIGAETGLTPAAIDWARGHFINHVRSGGPFPTLRCGTQPYGVLPVTSMELWAPGAGEGVTPQETWLKDFLRKMRDSIWRPVVPSVARIGRRSPADPDADLVDIMQMDGVSHELRARAAVGLHYLEHLYSLDSQSIIPLALNQTAGANAMLTALGLPTQAGQRPHAATMFYTDTPLPLTAPLIQQGEVSPWQMLTQDYIGALLNLKTIQAIIDARPAASATDRSTSVLQTLLRHSLLREYATAAARIAAATVPGSDLGTLLRDLELVDLVDAAPANFTITDPAQTTHWRRQLTKPSKVANINIGAYLEGPPPFTDLDVTAIGDFRTALTRLQMLDSESLQILMQGTLDLSAHRLDAWITSYATKRLSLMTAQGATGQFVGGYGWVENLRQKSPLTQLPATALPSGEQGPVYPLAKDSGFIHAPSLAHASTAALLRNAHLGPTGAPTQNSPFAIDLSSRRVRAASRLLDGVREGQPLSALLGYHFERRLHDMQLDRFIVPLRNIAPLVVREREQTNTPAESLAANNVVDGLALLRKLEDPADKDVPAVLVTATPAELSKITAEFDALNDAVDGLADSLTAEAAYQMVRGNTSRLGSTLAAIAHGDAPPPELEVARMPRSGNAVTHRLMVLMAGNTVTAPGWLAWNSTVTANNNNMLNSWISRLLPDAHKVRCTIEQLDDTAGAVVQTLTFPLSDVPMTQLDFVYAVEPAGVAGKPQQGLTTVEQMMLYHARRMAGGFSVAATLRFNHARPGNLAVDEVTLFDVMEQARAIRRLLENARGVRPEDLSAPEVTNQSSVNTADLTARVVRFENGLNAAYKVLLALVTKAPTATYAEDLRTQMLTFIPYQIGPAVPAIASGDTPDIRVALLAQANALLKIAAARLAAGTTLRAQPAATDPRALCTQLLERARAVFGAGFVILPLITPDAATTAELKSALAASTQLQGGDPLAVHGWFTQCARVRDVVARFGACMRGAEVYGASERLALSVAQLPFIAGERWVGLPLLPLQEIAPSKLSLVIQSAVAIDTTRGMSGLLVDEWVEVVPNRNETTAITFQFDPPNSFAPQNVLIAVPPVPGQDWTTETLRQVLVETLDLAKLRAVDSALLGAAAQYLPALYVPFNSEDDAVSTDFASLTV
ncbi:MAG: hypothetical protein ABJE10_01000 [bacterium]